MQTFVDFKLPPHIKPGGKSFDMSLGQIESTLNIKPFGKLGILAKTLQIQITSHHDLALEPGKLFVLQGFYEVAGIQGYYWRLLAFTLPFDF